MLQDLAVFFPRVFGSGFISQAEKMGYPAPYPIPEENADAWMVQSLKPDGFIPVKGEIACAMQLDKPEYWHE